MPIDELMQEELALIPRGEQNNLQAVLPPGGEGGSWQLAGSHARDGVEHPAIWSSTTPAVLESWTREVIPDLEGLVRSLERSDDRSYGVGHQFVEGQQRALVIHGTNGVWTSVDTTGLGAMSSLSYVVAGSSGDVLVSGVTASGDERTLSSIDGVHFEPVVLGEGPSGRVGDARAFAISATGQVGFTAATASDGLRTYVVLHVRNANGEWAASEPDAFSEEESVEVTDVTTFRDGFTAVGQVQVDGVFEAAAWTSKDGTSWRRAESGFDVASRRTSTLGYGATSVRTNGDVLHARPTFGFVAALWRSTDGDTWTMNNLESVEGPGTSGLDVTDYGVGPDATVVMIDASRTVLVSSEWQRLANEGPFELPTSSSELTELAVSGSTVVGVGSERNEFGYYSGRTWTKSAASPWVETDLGAIRDDGAPGTRLSDVSGGQGGFVAGSTIETTSESRFDSIVLFDSPDGLTWEPRERLSLGARGTTLRDLVLAENGATAVGSGVGQEGESVGVYFSPDLQSQIGAGVQSLVLTVCNTNGGPLIAHISQSEGQRTTALLQPVPGNADRRFSSFKIEGSTSQRVDDCAAVGERVVAVGSRQGAVDADAAVWQSFDDGKSFAEVTVPFALRDVGSERFTDLVALPAGGGYIAILSSERAEDELIIVRGDDWSRVPTSAGAPFSFVDIEVADGRVYLSGAQHTTDRIWSADLEGLLNAAIPLGE